MKNAVRQAVKETISNMTEQDRRFYSVIIASKLYRMEEFRAARSICCYNSFQNEVDTKGIIITALNMGKILYMPKVFGEEMQLVRVDHNTVFEKNEWGIAEPVLGDSYETECDFQLIIVPLIAFDNKCNRLGRGKGYYDKFLKHTGATRIAIAYSAQQAECVYEGALDVPMDYVITEKFTLKRGAL